MLLPSRLSCANVRRTSRSFFFV